MRLTVKLGGSLLENDGIREGILRQVRIVHAEGHEVILVHGGGKSLSRRLGQLGIVSRFVGGLRVTDPETLQVAVMVLAGEVNKKLVAELGLAGVRAVGICGADGMSIRSRRAGATPSERPDADLGLVGVPTTVDRGLLDALLRSRFLPVVASIAAGEDGHLHNVNADQMASACAWGSGCEALLYLTDVPGVGDESGSLIPRLGVARVQELIVRGVISGGMFPKSLSCLEALAKGVPAVRIVQGGTRDVLTRFVQGTLDEGTHFHADA